MDISVSLSGGGYRASAYHLGVLHYLDRLTFPDGSKLLDDVNTVTGVSGGALTALWYVKHELQNKSRIPVFRELYHLLDETNIANELIEKTFDGEHSDSKLINILSEIYDKKLFHGEKFDIIMDGVEKSHVHNVSIDATDLNTSLPFRFQATCRWKGNNPYGFIGNKTCSLPRDLAKCIKLSDILAASSCFPVAFEPLIIDETYNEDFANSSFMLTNGKIVLMDGGVIDNLSIDPALKARDQLLKQGKDVDLMILSDVSNIKFSGYEDSAENKRFCSSWSIESILKVYDKIRSGLKAGLIVCLVMIVVSVWLGIISLLTFFAGISMCILAVLVLEKRYSIYKINIGEKVIRGVKIPLELLKSVRFNIFEKHLWNRFRSIILMSNDIVMTHIRRKYLDYIYNDEELKKKVLLNAQYTLLDTGSWKDRMIRYDFLPPVMRPSKKIHDITDEAYDFPTTLWFTDKDKQKHKLDKLVACGQFTTCWNLLVYIHKLENDGTKGKVVKLLSLKKQLLDDWRKFNNDPLFMVERIK